MSTKDAVLIVGSNKVTSALATVGKGKQSPHGGMWAFLVPRILRLKCRAVPLLNSPFASDQVPVAEAEMKSIAVLEPDQEFGGDVLGLEQV
jgi:hypothetical protein